MFGFIVTYSFRNCRLLPKVNVVQFLQHCSECKVGNFLYHLLNLPVFSLLSSSTNNHGKPDNKWKVPSCWFADSGKILPFFNGHPNWFIETIAKPSMSLKKVLSDSWLARCHVVLDKFYTANLERYV